MFLAKTPPAGSMFLAIHTGGSLLKFPVLFPHFAGLRVARLLMLDGMVHIDAHRPAATAHCPSCGVALAESTAATPGGARTIR